MVSLTTVRSSNSRIANDLPKRLVAVFAGATSGIGEATLKAFVKYVPEPRVYLFARSASSAQRVIAECESINSKAKIDFVKADLSSIVQTDKACRSVLETVESINLVFNSAGEVSLDRSLTSEGLHAFLACVYYSKLHMIELLLPRLKAAAEGGSFARVVAVAGGSKEGAIDVDDLPALKLPLAKMRAHLTSMITLSLQDLAESAPRVSFVHNYPGTISTPLFDGLGGIRPYVMKAYCWLGWFLGWGGFLGLDESGERQVFNSTSAMYPPKTRVSGKFSNGVADPSVAATRGIDGIVGSGSYSTSWDGEPASSEVEALVRQLRDQGTNSIVRRHNLEQFEKASSQGRN